MGVRKLIFTGFLCLSSFVFGQSKDIEHEIEAIWELRNSNVQAALSKASTLVPKVSGAPALLRLKVLDLMGSLLKDNLQYDSALSLYGRMTELADSVQDTAMRFNAMLDAAGILSHYGKYDSVLSICRQVLIQADERVHSREIALAYVELGTIFRFRGSVDLAYANYLKAKDIFRAHDDQYMLSMADFGLAEVFHIQKKYNLATDYLKRSLLTRKRLGTNQSVGHAYSRLGNMYETIDDQHAASAYFDSALVIFQRIGDLRGIANARRKLGKVFRRQKSYDSARIYLQDALRAFESINDKRQISKVYRQLSIVERKQRHFNSALPLALKAVAIAADMENLEIQYNTALEVVLVYKAMGDFQKALDYQAELTRISLEWKSRALDERLGAVKSAHELEESLLLREQELAGLEARSRKSTISLLAVIIGLLALFIIFSYRQYVRDVRSMQKIKHQNKTISSNNRQIAAHAEELKKFAYATSHDLKAPLRGISNISEWLKNDYNGLLDTRGQELLNLMKSRVRKMEYVLDDILAYFKIGSTEVHPENVDIESTVREIDESLIRTKKCRLLVHNSAIELQVDKLQFYQVMFNLIDNGIRHNDKPFVKIETGFTQRKGLWYLYVKDNGIGIEEKYHEKIFEMFQTLNHEQNEDNTGIGLAIVKRIIESWQSEIFVESEFGMGSTFYIRITEDMVSQSDKVSDFTGSGTV